MNSALERGVVFSGLVTDGDNKTHEALKNVYLGVYDNIERFECLRYM